MEILAGEKTKTDFQLPFHCKYVPIAAGKIRSNKLKAVIDEINHHTNKLIKFSL